MLSKLMLLVEHLTGTLLGSLAVGTQMANVFICILIITAGPTVVLRLMQT
jgi:hypothetical protein